MTCIMRSVVLALGVSIDGYIARPDGTFDFLFMPRDFSMAEFFASVDTAVMGRKTYEVSKAMGGGPGSSRIKNYVFSRSLPAGEREGFTFVDQSPETFIHSLRQASGKDIWLMGGGQLARDFLWLISLMKSISGLCLSCSARGCRRFPPAFRNATSN